MSANADERLRTMAFTPARLTDKIDNLAAR
jgi:hypothetical protein